MIKAKSKTNRGNYYEFKKTVIRCDKRKIPKFDENENYFIIKFEGGGDEFGSFQYFNTDIEDDDNEFNPEDYFELIMEIMDKSGVYYTFLNYGSSCEIVYSDGILSIETESPIEFDESEFSKTWQDTGEFDNAVDADDAYQGDMEIKLDKAILNE